MISPELSPLAETLAGIGAAIIGIAFAGIFVSGLIIAPELPAVSSSPWLTGFPRLPGCLAGTVAAYLPALGILFAIWLPAKVLIALAHIRSRSIEYAAAATLLTVSVLVPILVTQGRPSREAKHSTAIVAQTQAVQPLQRHVTPMLRHLRKFKLVKRRRRT